MDRTTAEAHAAARPDDIATPRLILRRIGHEAILAALAGDLAQAGRCLGAAIPDELLVQPEVLRYGLAQLDADPHYAPWGPRAIMLPGTRTMITRTMIGHLRFHSRPDPDYLHSCARNAVELGYLVFEAHRRCGYAAEALGAAMDWAQAAFAVRHFVASVAPDNEASLRLARHFGFTKVGTHMDEVDGLEHVLLRTAPKRSLTF
jgi:ribosomal-protein-alanine N-acetyltransferase